SLAANDRDVVAARMYYERAVSIDPGNGAAWDALKKDAERAGDFERAAYCVERRAMNTESPRVRAQLLVDLAQVRARLRDAPGAFAAYEQAADADPTNEAAAREVLP